MLMALHPLTADGFRLHGSGHDAWEESLEVLHSAYQASPALLAGPPGLSAPSTKRGFHSSLTPRGMTMLLLQHFLVLLSPCCPQPWCWSALPCPQAKLALGVCSAHVPASAGVTQHRSFPRAVKIPFRIPGNCLFCQGTLMHPGPGEKGAMSKVCSWHQPSDAALMTGLPQPEPPAPGHSVGGCPNRVGCIFCSPVNAWGDMGQ